MWSSVFSPFILFLLSKVDTAPKWNCPFTNTLFLIFLCIEVLLYIWECIVQLQPTNSGSHWSSVKSNYFSFQLLLVQREYRSKSLAFIPWCNPGHRSYAHYQLDLFKKYLGISICKNACFSNISLQV